MTLKIFDASTFTGTIEYSDIEYVKKRIVEFENGDIKKIKSDEADTGENYDNQEEARWGLWDTIKCFLFNLCDEEGNGPYHSGGSNGSSSGSSGSNNSGGPSGSNNPHSSHVVIISPFYFGSDNQQGTNNQNPNNPSGTSGSYAGYTTVANESWPSPEETNQLTRADLIVRRLGLPNEHLWLKNSTNQNNPIIFSYLYENSGTESYTEANEVAKLAIRDMKRNPTLFSSMNPFIILNKINSNSLDACTKGIFNRLKSLSGNDIPTIMARFDAPESIFNINMSQGTVEQEQGMIRLAQTTPTSATNYDIIFNQDHFKDSGATNLLKAQAIVHEIFHALIFSIVRNPSNPNLDNGDFQTIWNAYVNHEFGDNEEGHHLFLANNYVNVIGAILQEYDTGVPVVGGNVSQLYRDMAWAGLTPIPVPVQSPFNNMLSGEDQARLYGRFHAELTRAEVNGTQPSSTNPCRN